MAYVAGSSALKTENALKFMLNQVGKPYIWGGIGPNGFDCSGLAYTAYRREGVNVSRTTYTMLLQGDRVSPGNVAPGDFIFPHAGHVFYYLGNGKVVEAPRTGLDIRVRDWDGRAWQVRRLVHPSGPQEVTGDVTQPDDGASGNIWTALEPLAAFAEALTNPITWYRVGMVVGGLAMILIAASLLMKTPAKNLAKTVRKLK